MARLVALCSKRTAPAVAADTKGTLAIVNGTPGAQEGA
jgi:hypothetical protein